MFYKIGFWVFFIITVIFTALFFYTSPMKRTGALSWVDIYSDSPTATIGFLNENFGITVVSTSKSTEGGDYSVIRAKGQLFPFAGIMNNPTTPDGRRAPAGSTIYLTVKDYDAAHAKAISSGATPYATHMKVEGMYFGFYMIPGNVGIGLVEYVDSDTDKK